MQMIGIWFLTVWQQLGSPSKMRLVELGPGRGTLMADLLRGTASFKPFTSGLDIHLVEVSYRNFYFCPEQVLQGLAFACSVANTFHSSRQRCSL